MCVSFFADYRIKDFKYLFSLHKLENTFNSQKKNVYHIFRN